MKAHCGIETVFRIRTSKLCHQSSIGASAIEAGLAKNAALSIRTSHVPTVAAMLFIACSSTTLTAWTEQSTDFEGMSCFVSSRVS